MVKKKKNSFKKIILIILLCFMIVGTVISVKLSKEVSNVMAWEAEVKKTAKEFGVEEYTEVILAIIFTESKGNHVDLMQSSESKYGARNQIFSSEESIESGVEYLATVIEASNEQGCDIWTAVQAYNFGVQYITYVSDSGKENSLELAESYSRDVLAPLLGNTTEATYSYKHPKALLYNGGKLYNNGGNLFYAENVKWNLKIINLFK